MFFLLLRRVVRAVSLWGVVLVLFVGIMASRPALSSVIDDGIIELGTVVQVDGTYDLDLYQIDDTIEISITNSSLTDHLVLSHSHTGGNTTFSSLGSYFTLGSNLLTLRVFNGPKGWTYGYRLWEDSMLLIEDSCGIKSDELDFGCNGDAYDVGLVYTVGIRFDAVPEPSTALLLGLGLAGMAAGRRRIR